ncbi:hypothetical protein PV327_011183 [Microctonus hyperodae]|uniref:DUF4806 domain-containing protein n=1 Tax=Microctonus hyperodae TaxID=165561 RepID=A0AA39C548_MICHY|nr:hypothetical protein PV327_011183 [Microctonus hyperodae]
MERAYAMIYFVEQSVYSEIPSNWLLNESDTTGTITKCKWPPSFIKNLNFYLKNRLTPCDNWLTYDVKIIRYCDTLVQARKAAEDSEYSSAAEKPLGKGYRLKRPSAIAAAASYVKTTSADYISSEEENDMTVEPAAKIPKINKTKMQATVRLHPIRRLTSFKAEDTHNDDLTGLGDNDNNKKNNSSIVHDTHIIHNSASIDDDDDDVDVDCFYTLNNKLKTCLKLLGTLVVGMKDLQQRVIFNNGANSCQVINEIAVKVKNDLPLKSRDAVTDFEEQLSESKDYCREFVRIVNQVGGSNGKEYTERVLNTIFTPSFAAENTWEGKKTKYKINNLKLIKVCEDAILKKFSSWDSAQFSKAGNNWFRLGNQRAGQQPGQKEKQNTQQRDPETSE